MSLSTTAIKRPIFMTSVVLVSLLVGVLSFSKLGVDLFPDVTFPVVVTYVTYHGASPEEIETLISKPIEDEVSSVSGIKRLSSTNQEGLAVVVAEFTLGTDVKYAEQQVRDKLSSVRNRLPKDIDEPVISRVDISDQPIVQLSLSGDVAPTKLFDVADSEIKPLLSQVKDVGSIDILGGDKREIKVEVDRKKLKARELSITALTGRIAASASNVPVGKVETGRQETVFRTIGEYKSVPQIKDTVVNFFGSDVPVKVGDVASVNDSVQDETSRSFLGDQRTLFLAVHKQSGTNTVEVADGTLAKMAQINKYLATKPGNMKLSLIRDSAKWIRANVEDVRQSILLGILLAVTVVFLFLGNVRSTFITGLALPNSLLGAFILMYIMGFTINIMTLLALSLAVGLLIDDAIVVRENIFRRIEEGESPKEAAELGTKEVTLAVVATSLTVIAVFLPVGFLSGAVGQFFKQFGMTIVFAMTISLFDALTMAPMLSAYLAGRSKPGRVSLAIERFHKMLNEGYRHILGFTLRHRLFVLALSVGVFVFSIWLGTNVKFTFMPNSDNGEFNVNLEMPPGTNLDATEEVAKKVEKEIKSYPEVDRIALTVGNAQGESNVASFYVALVDYRKRTLLTTDIKDKLRATLKQYAYAKPVVGDVDVVGGHMKPFMLNLAGDNLEEVNKYAERIVEKFKKIPGLVDVDTNYRLGKPEFQVRLIPQKAERYGVLSGDAGQELRGQMEGIVAAKYREAGEEYDIRVRLKEDQRNLKQYFNETYVPNINGNLVRVSDVADGVMTQGPSKISRFNRARMILIDANLGPGGALGNIRKEAEKILADEKLPPDITYSFQGQAEDFQDLMINMVIAMGLAVAFVFLILSSLYESFITPFTIMLALPLAVAGAFIALFITKQSMNLFSMIGIIMLLGLVTKNSILLVDYTLQLTRKGIARDEALMEAGLKRLRPILMTTIALIAGMLPVALGLSEAARFRTSMGVSIIGGLVSSTLLSLVVVPAAFGYIDDFRGLLARIFGKLFLADDSNKGDSSRGSEIAEQPGK